MTVAIKMAFEAETVTVALAKLLPTKALSKQIRATSKYRDIGASVPVVGVIEPPIVCRQTDGNYLILDGHKRVSLLQDAGATEVECVVSTDDESYTYNIQVSHLVRAPAHRERRFQCIVNADSGNVNQKAFAAREPQRHSVIATARRAKAWLNKPEAARAA